MTLAYNDRRGKQSGVKTPIKYYLVPKTTIRYTDTAHVTHGLELKTSQ